MGLGTHGLQLFRFAAKQAELGRVATIGRQQVGLNGRDLRRSFSFLRDVDPEKYCESLLVNHFGAAVVDSWDFSDYEGATHVWDMNHPLQEAAGEYDTVFDGGSLEHVYNVPQALLNVSRLCRNGGQILHLLPANNFCGHGFWQFSPELFYSLYSEANGYSDTRVFLSSEYRTDVWYEVRRPRDGNRVNVTTLTPLFVLCRTVKRGPCSHDNVQQSDYVHVWRQDEPAPADARPHWRMKLRSALQKSYFVEFGYMVHSQLSGRRTLSARNSNLIERPVQDLLQ